MEAASGKSAAGFQDSRGECRMGVALSQQLRIGAYILKQRLRGVRRYPLVLMLEPLFRCNLACAGCGKIDYPDSILDKRMSVDEAIGAVEECGAPVVSIAGGEPLIHGEIGEIAERIVATQAVCLSVHQRAVAGKEAAPVPNRARSSRSRSISTAPAKCMTAPSARRACTTRRCRRSPRRAPEVSGCRSTALFSTASMPTRLRSSSTPLPSSGSTA